MSKIHRKECKSLKEFNKIIRKYIKYFGKRWNYYHNYWYIWIYVDIIGKDNIKNLIKYAIQLKNKNEPNLFYIINTILDNYNCPYEKDDKVYYLKGIEISNEDYYYIYVSDNNEKTYMTCVGGFDTIK